MMRHTLRVFLVMFFPVFLFSQETGKIAGTVTDDATGEPLVGANILVEGTSFGAATDSEGKYRILGVPASTYAVRAEFIGYRPVRISNVRVSSRLTTDTDFALTSEALELGVVEVVAERPLINPSATNAIRSISSEQIANFATRNVADFFSIQPGVVIHNGMLHIRGSRPDEVGYELEGASTKAIARGGVIQAGQQAATAELGGGGAFNLGSVIAEALEEVTIQSGGYTADLGGSNAGIIQQKLKTGGQSMSGSVLYETDALAPALGGDETFSYGATDFTATLGGPLLSNRVRFFGAVQRLHTDDFTPQFWFGADIADKALLPDLIGGITPSGDSVSFSWGDGDISDNTSFAQLADGTIIKAAQNKRVSDVTTFNGTLLFDFNPLVIRVGGALNSSTTQVNSLPLFRMFNDRLPERKRSSSLINVKGTMFLSSNTLINVNVNRFSRLAEIYDPNFKHETVADILEWGDSTKVAAVNSNWVYKNQWTPPDDFNVAAFRFQRPGDITTGYSKSEQSYIGLNGGLVSQITDHEIKIGFDWRRWTYRQYSFGAGAIRSVNQQIDFTPALEDNFAEKDTTAARILRRSRISNIGYDEFGKEITDEDNIDRARHPYNLSFYIMDKIEMDDIVVNAGVRVDRYKLDDFKISDVLNPPYDKTEASAFEDSLLETDPHTIIQPRLGLAFPLSDRAVFHLQYGKFAQFPDLGLPYKSRSTMAANFGGQNFIRDPVGFDLEPIITTQYEAGFAYQLGEVASFDVTIFARNTVGQLVLEQVLPPADNTYGAGEYSVYNNGDFTTASGLEFAFQTRRVGPFQAILNYTWTDARGTNSNPNSTVGNLSVGAESPTLITPLQYEQKHRGAINLDTRFGKRGLLANSGINLYFTFNSGHPFTHSSGGMGQRNADDGPLLTDGDPRSREPMEPIGASTTPWVFNTGLKADMTFDLGNASLTAYVIVTNLFNSQNVLNVYNRSGNAFDDGFLSDPALSDLIVQAQGPSYVELYQAVNLGNRQHWITDQGYDLFDIPRQIKLGVSVGF
ncbi:MAG: TonB-dependent receptor [Candidatus Marinimicrobia bacterium]|nr:TonB-dependent receptor [Candidatus Neomarinimicrobiota bacterium]